MSSWTYELLYVLGRGPEPRSRADEVERRAARARELARSRDELAGLDSRDRGRELGLEVWHVCRRERRADDRVGSLEEVVDDLHLLRAGAEARKRVHEALQPVVLLHDLFRRSLGERVRLVVDDERAAVRAMEDVDEAVDQHAVVLERELHLRGCIVELGYTACE